jgi:ABC-2 type transport system ATP-binding protein
LIPTDHAIRADGLAKSFGSHRALAGVDLEVPAGSVCAVLGRNGAGKTTAVRILTTLLQPDAGRAEVAGFDVVREPARVRARIGVTGQSATMDELLTGRQNLDIIGRLYHLSAARSRERAQELLERFRLTDAADRLTKGYSGGMRRRLDLAASMVAAPAILFLDEPTTGLDPISRGEMWQAIREMVGDGTTVLLTTQYLDEADQLADSVAVIDAGRVAARGTPAELKSALGHAAVRVTLPSAEDPAVLMALAVLGPQARADGRTVAVPAPDGLSDLAEVVERLRVHRLEVLDVALAHATLDEVFAALTSDRPAGALTPTPAPASLEEPVAS